MINGTLFYVFKVIFSFILLNSIVKFKKISLKEMAEHSDMIEAEGYYPMVYANTSWFVYCFCNILIVKVLRGVFSCLECLLTLALI